MWLEQNLREQNQFITAWIGKYAYSKEAFCSNLLKDLTSRIFFRGISSEIAVDPFMTDYMVSII